MTTVVAVARDGVVYMAGDSMVNLYDRPILGGIRKVLRKPGKSGGEVLLGVCGDAAIESLIRAELVLDAVPAAGEDGHDFATAVAFAVTDLARDRGVVEEGRLDGQVLLGWNGKVLTIAHALAIWHPDGIGAIGSGEGPAIGAVDALLELGDDPAGVVKKAVRIAIGRDRHSEGPIHYQELTAKQSAGRPRAAKKGAKRG